MIRIGRIAAVAAAVLTIVGTAQAATPASVQKAVTKWTKTALQIQDSLVLPGATQLANAVTQAQSECQSAAATRPTLASVITTFSKSLKLFVNNTERGELKLYALAPKLGSKKASARKHYVALLDNAGKILDHELNQVKLVATASHLIGSGSCSKGVSDVDTAVGLLHIERNSLNVVIGKLRAQYG